MKKTILAILVCTAVLVACGGGGGSESLNNSGTNKPSGGQSGNTSALDKDQEPGYESPDLSRPAGSKPIGTITRPTQVVSLSDSAKTALNSGNPSTLSDKDAGDLLEYARGLAWTLRDRQTQTIANIYGNPAPALQLNHSNGSRPILVIKNSLATPLISSDNGTGMAAVAQVGNGRALAYGADLIAMLAGTTQEQQHLPFFSRALNWLLTGNADTALPKSLNFATASYNGSTVKTLLARLGSSANAVSCAIEDPANTCWKSLDLLVFGRETTDNPALGALIRTYLEAGKPVIYMQTNTYPKYRISDGGEKVLNAMGMSSGDNFNGHYFSAAESYSVSATRTAKEALATADQFAPLLALLELLKRNDLQLELANSFAPDEIDKQHAILKALQENGNNIFNESDREIYRSLVLWADWYRTQINYGGTLSASGDSDVFLRTYASDSWLWFNRSSTSIPPNGAGDYMPAAAANIAVTRDYETIEVTLPQSSGITLIGRAAIPGKVLNIQVQDAAGSSSLSLQTNYLRVSGKPLTDKVYARPRRPHSFLLPLAMGGDNTFVSPFGGPLMLAYSGATPGSVVKLRIKGSAKYAHFDFTRNPSQAELDEATAAVARADFGWQTAKFTGGEVQQTIGNAKKALGDMTPEQYVLGRLKRVLFDSNHFANGYDNMPMSDQASALCTALGWTCTGALHKPPSVQHFVGWIATCGFMCSGNPSDANAPIEDGWGAAHELGHNTVQRVMTIAPNGNGCKTECNNNILAFATMMRKAVILGQPAQNKNDYVQLYQAIVDNRKTGLSGEAQRADMEARTWAKGAENQAPLRVVHFQIAFQYSKLRIGETQPSMERTLEFLQLLTKGDRLVAKAWDPANKAKYGMGRFPDNKISNEDLFYVLSSRIIGYDMRKHFAMLGIPLSDNALGSIADLKLPLAPLSYYALASGKTDLLSTGQWLDLETGTPAFPF
ncbi:ImpA family metalloprotease [Chitinibacter tainanensis]|uniref:ImpA family metalloprotease n=1 Tax=Chitinibacter tainanensis TaxID=230667 RepID=UPI002356A0DB|nr:ImpA family metalloprotease [Chitinibacter tainanensis]